MPAAPTHAAHLRQTAILATLRRSQMFADLAAEDLAAVAAACQTRRLAKGEVLFREGEKATGFYVVQSGQISVHRITPDGRERIICVFAAPGEFRRSRPGHGRDVPGQRRSARAIAGHLRQ